MNGKEAGHMNGNLAYQLDAETDVEIIGGRVVMLAAPSSNHNRTTHNISFLFESYLRHRPCQFFPDREAVYLEEDTEEYQPDGMVVCDPEKVKPDGIHGVPDLVVEVISPSTAQYDRGHKKDVYERHGVREYWIVDPANRTVEQFVLEDGVFILRGVCSLCPEYMLKRMNPEQRAGLATEFRCSLFEDLTIRLEDVFYRVFPGL